MSAEGCVNVAGEGDKQGVPDHQQKDGDGDVLQVAKVIRERVEVVDKWREVTVSQGLQLTLSRTGSKIGDVVHEGFIAWLSLIRILLSTAQYQLVN